MKRTFFFIVPLLVICGLFSCGKEEPTAPQPGPAPEVVTTFGQGSGDPAVLAMMDQINEQLAAQGLNMAVESIEFFSIGNGRPSNRIHQQPFRWVPNDPRRFAQGIDITYIVDQSAGATASGLSNAQTEAALDRAMTTWNDEKALRKVEIVKRTDPLTDVTIFDAFFGFGGSGNPFAADIVNAGWLPRAFFEAVGGPGGGRGILAFSVTFIFVNPDGSPTDINGDNYIDTALNEVYYNDTFGDPGDDRAGNPWGIDIQLPGIDVETVGLHENGHSLEIGHFGPPPDAVMNPVYAGPRQSPMPIDKAGMHAVWSSWPNP
ncbi:MAG: matrixin family metalloprotease [bacterium]